MNSKLEVSVKNLQWDQRKTLLPPPYEGALKKYIKGIEIGDAYIDALPAKQLMCHGSKINKVEVPTDIPEPEWVDWEQVARGQEIWLSNLGRTYQALGFALLVGFSISRFAEVLYHSGYAQSSKTAFFRYNATGNHIVDWFRYPLNDPTSKSRKSIHTVRLMHGLARRASTKLFDRSKGEGIPLSQYDTAEVLLGFAIVTLTLMETEMKVTFTREEKEDMTACWRVIGYYLGILDEFNLCSSFDELEACFEDYMKFTPARVVTARASTLELQRTAIEGFGKGTGLGKEYWYGILAVSIESLKERGVVFLDVEPLKRKPKPGMTSIAQGAFRLMQFDWVNTMTGQIIMRLSDLREDKTAVDKIFSASTMAGKLNDAVLWQVFSMIFAVRKAALLLAILYFFLTTRRRFRIFSSKSRLV